ncbi:translation initiation factor eIF-2B [Candidatus Dojkabacteria bacterium]|nr:translation initiation factor eIF-2B [Candidatus Dojkabacteria bacterium]
MSYLNQIKEIKAKIKNIEIQGATNVALATLGGIKITANESTADSVSSFLEEIEKTGIELSEARENEPLAGNGVRYILGKIKNFEDLVEAKEAISLAIEEYVELINKSKEEIFKAGVEELKNFDVILTHCHSSTSTKILIELSKRNPKLSVVSTETRPLFQGRITAKKLSNANAKVFQIVDSAAPSFIEDDRYLPVECVLVGNDELLSDGSFINKIGTYSMALSAKAGKDKFYVATTLLKLNLKKDIKFPEIEMRPSKEVWEDAPMELKIINPAFDLIRPEFVTGYITEAGVITSSEVKDKALELYPWLNQ